MCLKGLTLFKSSHYLSHFAPPFKRYNFLNVHDIYLLAVFTFIYEEFNNKRPDIFHKHFNQQKKKKVRTKHAMLTTMRFIILKQILPGKPLGLQLQKMELN